MRASELFELPESLQRFSTFFDPTAAPWEWLPRVAAALAAFDFAAAGLRGDIPPGVHISGDVYLHPSVKLPPYAVIEGPAYIGPDCQIRPGAYIRGRVIVGRECVLGNSCEYKNCLLMDNVETAHFNYVGDSVLGSRAHLGAGVILANVKLDRREIAVRTATGGRAGTGLKKLGALIGERAEIGCNAVLNPGTILGKRAMVMPTTAFGGYLAEGKLAR